VTLRDSIEALDVEAAQRLADVDLAVPHPDAKLPAFDALKSETPPGCCVGCDEPLTDTRKKLLCGDPECLEVYRAAWYAGRHGREKAVVRSGAAPLWPRDIALELAAEEP
jgi:hypothetical protein